ncbi:MAG: hypothetical protein KDA22_16935 [Phycisphaerales bacterium]|nr:hypothetical protein [Phycisphaerales bacterium]
MSAANPVGVPIEWRAFPAAERPWATVGAVAVIAALAGSAWVLTGSIAWPAFSVVVLFLALCRYFLPTHYRFDEQGVVAAHPIAPKRLRWNEIRRCGFDDRGGFLGRRVRPSLLDGVTGVHLTFPPTMPAGLREAVVSLVRDRAERPGRASR